MERIAIALRVAALIVVAALGVGRAADESGPIEKVTIDGNIRVEEDAIRVHLQSQVGKEFDRATLDKDIRAVYGMGFFDQVNADVTQVGKGVNVTFKVKERPLVRAVSI
jgi:outer membrane protein insertion porin family